jgi:hypothetical protein
MMGAVRTSETSVSSNETTRRYIPNLESRTFLLRCSWKSRQMQGDNWVVECYTEKADQVGGGQV